MLKCGQLDLLVKSQLCQPAELALVHLRRTEVLLVPSLPNNQSGTETLELVYTTAEEDLRGKILRLRMEPFSKGANTYLESLQGLGQQLVYPTATF